MQIPSPNEGKPFKKTENGQGFHYDSSHPQMVVKARPLYKHRPDGPHTVTHEPIDIPDNPEVIDLETGQSNTKYYRPDVILNPEGCSHEFKVINIGKREVMCTEGCEYVTSFHPAVNFIENEQGAFIAIKKKLYIITL